MMMNSNCTIVRWTVIGYEVRTYQACHGAPIQPGGSCMKCGQGIKYIYRVKSTDGTVLEVGSDCAVTLEGGVELAEMRRAEREWEHEQYLKSPECARECAARESRKSRLAWVAEENKTFHGLEMAGLRAVVESTKTSEWGRDYASGKLKGFVDGTRDYHLDESELLTIWKALRNAMAPESCFVCEVGKRDKSGHIATLENIIMIGDESLYGPRYLHQFRTDEGAVLVWFATGSAGARQEDIGKTFRVIGSVKEHSVYGGTKQTVLTRCKLSVI